MFKGKVHGGLGRLEAAALGEGEEVLGLGSVDGAVACQLDVETIILRRRH